MSFLVNIATLFDGKPLVASASLLFLMKSNVGWFLLQRVDLIIVPVIYTLVETIPTHFCWLTCRNKNFVWIPKGFSLQILSWISPEPVYSTMVTEKFQIYSAKITGNTFVNLKICSFLLMPPSKTLPRVCIIISQADRNCTFLPNSVFWR